MRARQLFLDEQLRNKDKGQTCEKIVSRLNVLNWNIAHPSLNRAKKIANSLELRNENVLILTETCDSPGCVYISDCLESFGYEVIFPTKLKDFGTILAFRGFETHEFKADIKFLSHRAPAISCQTPIGEVVIIGVYVPSSVSRKEVNGKKERFQREFTKMFLNSKDANLVVCGDLNVLEPNHKPHYSFLRNWEYEFYESFEMNGLADAFRMFYPDVCEYSWYGREGYGYRYDHCFVSKRIDKYVQLCQYLHEPRENRLSDHSVMLLQLNFIV